VDDLVGRTVIDDVSLKGVGRRIKIYAVNEPV
jgi:hypothetical protein